MDFALPSAKDLSDIMSHLAKIELEVTDLESLSRACRYIGLTLVQCKITFKWYNGDGPCNHAIVIPNATYEIGLIQMSVSKWGV